MLSLASFRRAFGACFCFVLFFVLSAQAQNAAPAISESSIKFLEDEAEPQFNLSFKVTPAAAGTLRLIFDYQDTQNFYALELAPSGVLLRSVIGGTAHTLAKSEIKIAAGEVVTLQRRPWLMRVLVGRRVALTAYDATFQDGRLGFAADKWSYAEARVQPVEETIYYNDDFTREKGATGDWKNLSGAWQLTATNDAINASNQDMSANPFSFQASAASTPSLTHAGRRFWDNYDARVSVRPASQGTVGLAFYVQDASNYLALLWSSQEGENARQLVKVENGKSTLLGKSGGAYLPRQWYRIGVRTSPGFIEAFLDDAPVFRVRDDSFGQGAIGLYTLKTAANFDDVRVRSFPYFRQDFSGPTGGAWTPLGGFWRADAGILKSAPRPNDGGATRVLIAGDEAWDNYQFTASGRAGENGAVGLMAGYRDDKNFLVYRWAGEKSTVPFKGRAQLLRYKEGKAEILHDMPAPQTDKDGFARATLRYSTGALTVISDGQIVAQAADESAASGRPGLWVQTTAVAEFRDVVMFLPPEADPPKVAPKMEADALMVGWASPTGEWPPRRAEGGLEFWNTGEFFSDASLEYLWRPNLNGSGAWELSLGAKENVFNSGTLVRVEGKDVLKISVSRGGQVLKSGEVALATINADAANPAKLKIEREGRAILVSANGTPVVSYLPEDASTPAGNKIAARSTGYILQAKELRATSTNRDDYTFSDAPVDWYSTQGAWSVFHRWPCYSDWSFFGGKGAAPIIWSKREYSGDTVVEFYTHPQMNLPKELGYSHPGDLNVTLGGDGKNLSSGYSFVLAGWSNTKSAILKGNQIVAQSDAPHAIFDRAINQNSQFHRKWYYVRAEMKRDTQDGKDGVRLKYFVDNQLLCEYFDAAPNTAFENGGRVAFWTVNGAMMMARAKIESASPKSKSLPAGLLDAEHQQPGTLPSGETFVPHPVAMDGVASALVARESDAWKITNPGSGGSFATLLKSGDASTLRATSESTLDFEIALSPDAKIDCYVTIEKRKFLIELAGGARPDAFAHKLGSAQLTAGTGSTSGGAPWRHASFALGHALREQFPNSSHWTIEKIEFGALHGDEYRWAGFTGNPMGASYSLKNIRVSN